MKTLIRRFTRAVEPPNYSPLRSDRSTADSSRVSGRTSSFRAVISKAAAVRRRAVKISASSSASVPEGCVPVYVGDEMERFVVSAELLNHPVFIELLNKSAQEYGYEQQGALRIPCGVLVFERVMEDLRLGIESTELDSCYNCDQNDVGLEFLHFSTHSSF
ncbi:hypothetical protein ACFE04_025262 [Oxalis oulophora]